MYRIGIDLGGTSIKTGVVNKENQIVGRAIRKTNSEEGPEKLLEDLEKSVYEAIEDAQIELCDIQEIGIGAPGQIDAKNGIIVNACNLGARQMVVAPILEHRLGKKVYLENDATAALLGEYVAGAGKNAYILVFFTLGTGIGSGVLIEGKPYNGFNNVGVELGHVCIDINGEQCACGSRGCWEVYASANALIRQTKAMMQQCPESQMWRLCENQLERVNGKTAFEAMRIGDLAGKNVVTQYCKYVSVGIRNAIKIFQPDVLCVGGGVSNQEDVLLERIKKMVYEDQTIQKLKKKTDIRIAELKNDAGIIGAACLGMFQ